MVEKNKGGRPPHKPTDKQRSGVEMMAAVGVAHADIAGIVGIDDDTLRKHYRRELDLGKAKADAAVGGVIYREAMKGKAPAYTLYAKCRMGWSETNKNVVSGPNEGPIEVSGDSLADRIVSDILARSAEKRAERETT